MNISYVAFASTPLSLVIPSELLATVPDSPAEATPLLTLKNADITLLFEASLCKPAHFKRLKLARTDAQ